MNIKFTFWMWVACAEFLVIAILVFYLIKSKKSKGFIQKNTLLLDKIKNEKINMDSVVDNIFEAGKLYDQLKVQCHPDRFINTDKYEIADELYKEITKNKSNANKLRQLRDAARETLKI